MSVTTATPIKAFVLRDFKDATTEESFSAKDTPDLEAGRFENFRAAGLVRKATAREAKPAA
ncbi:hypothetical protein [Sphingomonas sp. Ant20]|uniref:hypothetical protein n=1 Tax=Sphingomonas sp. Ant20 TaxID=104605 RepID=UPI000537C1E2|nr:hypothetical protein [Sphingomonas sp. Ant20]KHA64275.1 hypothetical protein NI18_10335 [Sphingomonas sp. Ant20]